MWRCFFVFLEINPNTYKRDIKSFVHYEPSYVLEYDASLTGVGIILFILDKNKEEKEWKVIQMDYNYNIGSQSKYQNTVEFIGIVLGMVALSLLGVRNTSVIIRGDNKSSLKWGLTENYKSILSRRASLVLTTTILKSNILIEDQIHIAGVNNVKCDRLSRRTASPEDLGFKPEQIINQPILDCIIKFCDPIIGVSSPEEISTLSI
jgi:hypothetical protein